MNECLVTKLKSGVDNSNLPFYGGIRVKLGTPSKTTAIMVRFTVASGKIVAFAGSFNIVNNAGTVIESNLTSKSIAAPGIFYIMPAVADTKIALVGKYDSIDAIGFANGMPAPSTIEGYEAPVFDADDFNYFSNLTAIWNNNQFVFDGTFDFATIQSNFTNVHIQGNGSGTLKVIASGNYMFPASLDYFNVSHISTAVSQYQYNYAELDIMKFANCINATYIAASLSDNVTGNLNTLLDALYNNGKTSGSMKIQLGRTKVTYNGEEWNAAKVAEKGWSMDVTFTANGWTSSWDA